MDSAYRPRLSFWQVWNMGFGFLGVQLGWGLQTAEMSPIFKALGPLGVALLWVAVPLTRLLIQPVIGALSDRTWGALGRRRPYFLVGAILGSLALLALPQCRALWMLAGLLWILDAAIQVATVPLRALVADQLPDEQRAAGFAMQSAFIGAGAAVAATLPWMLKHGFGVASAAGEGFPPNVRLAFYIGGAVLLGAVLWTAVTSPEYPPENAAEFRREKAERRGLIAELGEALRQMPAMMKHLALVQFFTWLGLFCMWLHFANAVPQIFGATDPGSPLFHAATDWAWVCYVVKDAVTVLAAFALMALARSQDLRLIHAVCLTCGAVGLLSVGFIRGEGQKALLLLALGLGGFAWASILSMPYALLAGALPARRAGAYLGVFNCFIVLPEILAVLTFGPLVKNLLGGNLVHAVMAGGFFLLLAAVLTLFLPDTRLGGTTLLPVVENESLLPTLTPPQVPET